MKISEILKEKRKELGLTQEEAARLLGKNIQVYRAWEQGRSSPSLESLKIISNKTGIDFNLMVQAKLLEKEGERK